MMTFGVLGFIWFDNHENPDIPTGSDSNNDHDLINNGMTLYCAIYSVSAGALIVAWEYKWGRKRTTSAVPTRGLTYTLLSLFLFLSWPTLLPAFFCLTTAILNFIACGLGEVYDPPVVNQAQRKKPPSEKEQKADTILGNIAMIYASIKQQNKLGLYLFTFGYFAGNVVLFSLTVRGCYIGNSLECSF